MSDPRAEPEPEPASLAPCPFLADALRREPDLADWIAARAARRASPTEAELRADLDELLAGADPAGEPDPGATRTRNPGTELRRFRRRQLALIATRDLAGHADIDTILAEQTLLAEVCIAAAHEHARAALAQRHGEPRYPDGRPMPLLILGMGKLGGRELNFSSDIDLVYLFPEHGETDGARPLAHEEFFARVGRSVAQLLGSVSEHGFVYRVDLRLRPFGDSGPIAVSFDAFEDYLQQHGRDWERYAYVKARPIVGAEAFDGLYRDVLRPFVYRRYLDFGVFESLRGMKELIAREVERRELQQNVKLGPGGIREIEFVVQAFQLLRGGADPRLQTRRLLEALARLDGRKLLAPADVSALAAAYRHLRRLENRLQQWNDEQTHELPGEHEPERRAFLLRAMGAADWPTLVAALDRHRQAVAERFRTLVFAPAGEDPAAAANGAEGRVGEQLLESEPALHGVGHEAVLGGLGIVESAAVAERLHVLRESAYYRRLDEGGRRRLHALLGPLLRLIAEHRAQAESETLGRVLHVFESIGGRTVYLTLLAENGLALRRLVQLCGQSRFLAEQIASFPLLLDELLDTRLFEALPTRAELQAELRERLADAVAEDPERQVELLRQFQRAAVFRVAVADLTGRLPLMKVSDRLTDIAELIVDEALGLAWSQIAARHGLPRGEDGRVAGLAVVAYGKFGGIELGYASDLDLVFLHDSAGEQLYTDGSTPIAHGVFFLRLVQRLVHLLTMHSSAGRLYEVDTRLRPSGKGGLLVQSLKGFADYQREEAWTWEHQALLRSRAVAGTPALRADFERTRVALLQQAVKRERLREEVGQMRERMRAELAQRDPARFDIKHDPGGLTDIEFLAQYWALQWAGRHAELVTYSDTIRMLESLASIDLVPQATVDVLTAAYRAYRQRMHHLALEGRATVVAAAEFAAERAAVTAIWDGARLTGSGPGPAADQ